MKKSLPDHSRIYSFDIIRIVAVVMVVMIHTAAPHVTPDAIGSSAFVWGNLFDSFSRCAVPLFFMMSGALSLNQEKQIAPKKNVKSAINMFWLLIVWSVIYAVSYEILKPIVFHQAISFTSFLNELFNGHYHLWYLFALIGLYLLTPILRCFVKKENKKMIEAYLLFSLVICFCVPFLNQLLNLVTPYNDFLLEYIENYHFKYLYEYVTYYIVGWYITNFKLKATTRKILYLLGGLGVLTTFATTQFLTTPQLSSADAFYDTGMIHVFFYSLAVFVFLTTYFENKPIAKSKKMFHLSKLTFGVYLIHCIFLFPFKIIAQRIPSTPVAILFTCVGATVCSFIATWICSKIPLIKKLIRC